MSLQYEILYLLTLLSFFLYNVILRISTVLIIEYKNIFQKHNPNCLPNSYQLQNREFITNKQQRYSYKRTLKPYQKEMAQLENQVEEFLYLYSDQRKVKGLEEEQEKDNADSSKVQNSLSSKTQLWCSLDHKWQEYYEQ